MQVYVLNQDGSSVSIIDVTGGEDNIIGNDDVMFDRRWFGVLRAFDISTG